MTMDELKQQCEHLRGVLRHAENECHVRRLAEINAAMGYMRSLREENGVREAEAEWRFSEARLEVARGMVDAAATDLKAALQCLMDFCEKRDNP